MRHRSMSETPVKYLVPGCTSRFTSFYTIGLDMMTWLADIILRPDDVRDSETACGARFSGYYWVFYIHMYACNMRHIPFGLSSSFSV